MKKKLKAYLKLQIESNSDVKDIMPIIGGYSVILDDKVLPFDFAIRNSSVSRDGAIVKLTEE